MIKAHNYRGEPIAPPEMFLPDGLEVRCEKGNLWRYVGTMPTTISHQLYFVQVEPFTVPPYVYNATHKETLLRKFPGLDEAEKENWEICRSINCLETILMNDMYNGATSTLSAEEFCYNLEFFTGGGITRELARALLRGLTDKGLCRYQKGLFNEDGEPAGSGYGLTPKGIAKVEELMK